MIAVKNKIAETNQLKTPAQLWLMPVSVQDRPEASKLMDLMAKDSKNLLEKFLVVVDEQDQVSDGVLMRNLPEEMLAKINKQQSLRSN